MLGGSAFGNTYWGASAYLTKLLVAKTKELVYNIFNFVAKTKALVYNITGLVAKTKALVYNIYAYVSKTKTLLYKIFSTLREPTAYADKYSPRGTTYTDKYN